jgi:hypothetical protein
MRVGLCGCGLGYLHSLLFRCAIFRRAKVIIRNHNPHVKRFRCDFRVISGKPAGTGGKSVVLELSGPAGGSWRIGRSALPATTIPMYTLDFNQLASRRITPAEARSLCSISGDLELAHKALDHTSVPY